MTPEDAPGFGASAHPSPLAKVIAAAEAQLAAAKEGLPGHDPMRATYDGAAALLPVLDALAHQLNGTTASIAASATAARRPFTAAEREADTQHIAHAAYVGAHKGVMLGSDDLGRAATANERGWWGTAGILFATSLVSVGIVAYDEGRRGAHQAARGEALAAIAEAREDIRLAEQKSTLSLRQARAWAQLILANPDPIGAIEHGLNQRFDADGRRSLLVPLWLNAETLQPGMKPVGLPEPAHMPLPKK